MFQKNFKNLGAVNLSDSKYDSVTQRFLKTYEKLEKRYDEHTPLEQIYKEAIDMFMREREQQSGSFSSAFKEVERESKTKSSLKINLDSVLKE